MILSQADGRWNSSSVIPANAGGDPMRRRPDGVGAVIPANAGRFD